MKYMRIDLYVDLDFQDRQLKVKRYGYFGANTKCCINGKSRSTNPTYEVEQGKAQKLWSGVLQGG